jgi:hypothetical protein
LFQIKDKLEKEKGIKGIEFIMGDRKSEFSVPDRLIVPLEGANNNVYEITSKVGNSWFFSDNNFVRLLGINFKFSKDQRFYVYRHCLLEKTGLFDYIIWPWISKEVWGKISRPEDQLEIPYKIMNSSGAWNIFEEHNEFFTNLRKFCAKWHQQGSGNSSKYFAGKISCPRIRYYINDGCDEQYCADIVEITAPTIYDSHEVESYIIQFRRYKETNNTKLFYTIRRMNSNSKEIISIDEEKLPRLKEDIIKILGEAQKF